MRNIQTPVRGMLLAELTLQITTGEKLCFEENINMLRAAIAFFVIGLCAMLFGSYNIAGVSIEMGKMILFVFLALAAVSLVISLVSGKKTGVLN